MAKFTSPVLGYNNNVRHKNRVFHIQTEDSGVNHPHIITHLFMDGGRILKSMKRSYAEHVGSEGLTETVRGLMKEQHKAMFIALRDGQFDALVDGHVTHAAQGSEITKAPTAEGSSPKPPESAPKAAESSPKPADVAKPAAAGIEPAESRPAAAAEAKPAAPASEQVPATAPEAGVAAAAAPASEQAPPTDPGSPPSVAPRPPSSDGTKRSAPPLPSGRKSGAPAAARAAAPAKPSDLTMDFDALGKAAEGAIAPQPFFTSDDLPPPPKTAIASRSTGGGYSNVEDRAPASSVARPSTRHSGAEELRATPATRGGTVRSEPSRYAPARPAAIFGQPRASKAPPSSQSLFGDDLVGDKSLDEVILSYLAEDLERGK